MPQNLSECFDVVIVGGGVTGSSSACFIAGDAAFDGRIAVIEREPTYEHSPSAKASGGFRQQFSTPENIQIGLFGAHFVKHVGDYLSVGDEVPELGFREEGYLLLATPATLPLMTANHEVQLAHGAATHMQTPEQLRERFPWLSTKGLAGGCFGASNEGWLDPYALLQAYRRKARALGVTFVHDEVIGLDTAGARISGVALRSGTRLEAGAVVNAAGASGLKAMAELVGLPVPVESRKRSTFVFHCRESIGVTPLTITPQGCGFRPEGVNFIANMAPTPARDPDTTETEVDYYLFEERVWPVLAERVPAFESVKLVAAYCCHYDVNTLDENLIIDRHPAIDNYFLAGGFSGHGLQQSPAVGRAMSELVVHGGFRSLDLGRFGYERVTSGRPVVETNCF